MKGASSSGRMARRHIGIAASHRDPDLPGGSRRTVSHSHALWFFVVQTSRKIRMPGVHHVLCCDAQGCQHYWTCAHRDSDLPGGSRRTVSHSHALWFFVVQTSRKIRNPFVDSFPVVYDSAQPSTSIAPGSVSTVTLRASVAITSPSVATGIGAAQETLMLRARPILTCLRSVCVPSISFGM